MKIRNIISALLMAMCLPCKAWLVAEMTDGSTNRILDPVFVTDGAGNYTISGLPVDNILSISNYVDEAFDPEHPFIPAECFAKPAAILDINDRAGIDEDSESGRNTYSAEYMMQVAGLPYNYTKSLQTAMAESSLILVTTQISNHTFSADEYAALTEWVAKGGVFIAPAIEATSDNDCLRFFGLEKVVPKIKDYTTIDWIADPMPELAYIDTDEERSTYIGQAYIFTSIYTPSTARPLAVYDGATGVAAVKNTIGDGAVYTIGVRWRDVIQRAQLNKTGKNRVKNNNFEASADVYPLFVRGCYTANNPVAVWKHTIPDGYQTVLIPTHDCDSRTALEEMHWLSDYEHSLGLKAHYFITTHYFRQQGYMSAFYGDTTIPYIRDVLANGHTVGSHSVCHLPDFNDTSRFPLTVTTPEEYANTCVYDLETEHSSGGSTWAEVVMSKQILEGDLNNKVRSFRSGHLCMNANIPTALLDGGYAYSSCYSATDLWLQFPFFQRLKNTWTGDQSRVLELPLHYSDVSPTGVSMTEDNWMEAPAVWYDYYKKLLGNFAPNILLIHPNKEWKMKVQRMFIDMLDPQTTGLYNFEDYGDFWIKRLDMVFTYGIDSNNTLVLRVGSENLSQYKGQGLFIETSVPLTSIIVCDANGQVHPARIVPVSDGRLIAVI